MLVRLFFIITLLLIGDYTYGKRRKNVHHHMTRREIMKYFGVSGRETVPEYEVIHPYQSNAAGEATSFALHQSRHRRSTDDSDVKYYQLKAFGSDLHIRLKRNIALMNPRLTVESQNEDGSMTSHSVPDNTFYLGHVSSDPGSVVALSTHQGLTGMIQTSRDTLYVQPLPARLAKHVTSNEQTTPHLVIKRSLRKGLRRQRGSSHSDIQKYLKAAMVVPTSLVTKYGGHDETIQRLLVMANIVAGLFQDESIGATKINYIVTKINILPQRELKFALYASNQRKLMRMLLWTMKQNRDKKDFDTFSFISEGDSGVKSSHNTLCRSLSGSAVTDVGLETAWYITHGIGHNMGLAHDGSSTARNCPNKKFIMSSEKTNALSSHVWSACSRNQIQEFLNSGNRSWCLNDRPSAYVPTFSPENRGKLPGEIIDGDQQCRDAFTENFKHATRQDLRENCTSLHCQDGNTVVISAKFGVVDGTECGLHKWCIKGSCVPHYKWSPCSRSCGGGVQRRNKPCPASGNQDGAQKRCQEATQEWRICSPQPCPQSSIRHRDFQCQQRKAGPSGMIFKSDPCGLYCGSGRRWRKFKQVEDGTRCSKSGLDVCIQGVCQSVGCNHKLGSGARLDRCRVCNGNGTTCVRVEGNFTKQGNKFGPENAQLVVELPTGTFDASFGELASTASTIGLQNSAGRYLSKGNRLTTRKGRIFYAAGSKITRYNPQRSSADALVIQGPTTAPLRVVLIRADRQGTKGVRYQYFRPLFSNENADESSASFEWKTTDWTACSASCSSGSQTRDVWCVRSDDKTPASFSACGTEEKPTKTRSCNEQPCDPE